MEVEQKPSSSRFSAHTMNLEIQTKLKELLRNLTSTETKLWSDSCKEFIKLLNSDSGPEFVRVYLNSSHKLVEISDAWEVRKGKLGFSHILDLIFAILKHCKDDANLNSFARGLVEDKMGELYKDLNSREGKKQNAVLFLLASIVRRNSHLAWEVAKVFDFKLPVFRKLGEVRLRNRDKDMVRRSRSYSTRKAFVGFAMAFIEIGHPRLLRGVLQQKEMYSGVLRGLGDDDEETVVYVLSVLRDRVLVPESLVPPGLRSVLFGSVTLEQLVLVSGREDFAEASKLAYDVLVLACIDPENGLMPDLERQPTPLRGNLKRLLDLMKKLKATEVEYHKDLLRAIVRGRPLFGSAYLDEFPYNLENTSSTNWFAAISLAGDVVLSVREGLSSGFDEAHVQHILKCIAPRPFTKMIMNKGLLHSETLVKHGTLRLVLESVKLLDVLLCSVDRFSQSKGQIKHDWGVLKAEIQDVVRISLPDPQVLLTLLSPLNNHPKSSKLATKRKAETKDASPTGRSSSKRRKSNASNNYTDIEVAGVSSYPEVDMPIDGPTELGSELQEENEGDILKDIGDIWGSRQCSKLHSDIKDTETYFFSKLFDTLAIYYRTMPLAPEGLFGLFKYISSDSLSMSTTLLQSLLKLLIEHVNHTCGGMSVIRAQPQIFTHLKEFIPLLLYSPVREIKEQAYILAKEAMLSTGAFDNNPKDISAWFLFIPGYNGFDIYDGDLEVEMYQQLSAAVVSFLCDAVTTTGNNLYKYMELLMNYLYDEEVGKGLYHEVSPLIICVLEKCLRLLSSESGSFTLPQKSQISLYVCNTIKYLLETQVNAGPLSFLVDRLLSEKLENYNDSVCRCPCEWRPLNSLLCFARKLLLREPNRICSDAVGLARASSSDSLVNIISDIKKVSRDEYSVGRVGLTVGFSYSLVCASHTEIISNLPSILCISDYLQKATTVDTLIHCLSMSYIEPIEFASLGLLAVAFVSVSSPDDDVRKLGYEVLAKFKSTLEICRKKKDVKQLLLLLSYLQNGVQEPWQRIPSFITVFLAEVSLILLNPSHENYSTISMHLMNSPGVNLKTIPLFQKLFWSTSVNYKADRLWMLRLLYVGLSSEDDAQIYIRSSVFDMLISVYSSPLSDNDSKELIIQILKRAVQFHKTIGFLVDRCGLILWLSSIISSLYGSEAQETTKFTLRVLPILLEVVKSIISTRTTVEWLEKCVLEQLAELSSHLYKLIVGRVEVVMEQITICTPILQILIWVLKLSQKRKMLQPHFTMSFEGLYNLYDAVEACSKISCHAIMVLGLETILMSSPVTILQTDREKLTKFLRWAVKTAICSESTEVLLQPEDSDNCVLAVPGENSTKESLVSKLLRWLTASVILGKFSCKSSSHKSGSSTKNSILHSWESLLECREDTRNGGEDILASSIFYLLQLLGFRHNLLPSVVPALCLLLLGGSSSESLDGLRSSYPSSYSIIRSPPEANPAWRWSFDEPWSDLSLEDNTVEKLEEIRACEKLLVVASNTLLKNSLPGSQLASLDVKDLNVYDWERTLFQSE